MAHHPGAIALANMQLTHAILNQLQAKGVLSGADALEIVETAKRTALQNPDAEQGRQAHSVLESINTTSQRP